MRRAHYTLVACAMLLAGCGGTGTRGARYVMRDEVAAPTVACATDLAPRMWGVVVGVNFYNDRRIPDLRGAVNDAWAFYHFLASPAGGAVPRGRLRLLLNDQATRQSVEGALGNFLAGACPRDKVIIYFAGHGAPEPGRPDEAFLLVHDTNLDNMVGSAVSMSRLPDFLAWRAGGAGRLLMLVDACHAGNIAFPGARGFTPKTVALSRSKSVAGGLDRLVTSRPGWGAVSATAPEQTAGESSEACVLGGRPYKGGVFTCHLIEALAGAADTDRDGSVTLRELFAHVRQHVSEDTGGAQVPQESGTLEAELVLSHPTGGLLEIPRVPERFRVDARPTPCAPMSGGRPRWPAPPR